MNRFLIITTINSPNRILEEIVQGATGHGVETIIIGDKKTPPGFNLPGSVYVSPEEQQLQFPEFSETLPWNSYARKNIGYLFAISHDAALIQETDDDNIPLEKFWEVPGIPVKTVVSEKGGWYNVYRYFTENNTVIWPRGFPIQQIQTEFPVTFSNAGGLKPLVFQGLADVNPDVDAIYRMTGILPFNFSEREAVMLSPGIWCPFNSQNTVFLPEAYPLLYLPSTCSFRMTDIYRSLIAQRCLWASGSAVTFHSPTVYQERNEHDLLRDFEDEIAGYLNIDKARAALDNCELRKDDMLYNLEICYQAMFRLNLIKEHEFPILNKWIQFFKNRR